MELEQFKSVIKGELKALEDGMRKFVSDEVAQQVTKSGSDMAEIRAELKKLQDAGAAPNAQVVKDLESRLITNEETIRQMVVQLNSIAMSGGKKDTDSRDAELFKGHFIHDVVKLKNALQGYHSFTGENQKRAIDSSLFSTGGKLSPETADRFLDFLVEKTVALSRVTTRRMIGPEGKTDELTITARKIRKATEGTTQAVAGAIGTKRRTLTSVEIIWTEDITLTFLEDNIERAGAEGHIFRMLGQQFGNDMNDLAWNGNTAIDSTPDNFVETNDGWIKIADADADVNDVDAGALTTPSNTDILSAMYRAQQYEFLARLDNGYFMPVPFCQRYAEEVAARETQFGDSVLINGLPSLRYFGLPVVPEPHLYLTSADRGMLTPFANLYHGLQRVVTVDSEWVPRTRVVEITMTARNDYEYATGKAIVLVDNIPAGNR